MSTVTRKYNLVLFFALTFMLLLMTACGGGGGGGGSNNTGNDDNTGNGGTTAGGISGNWAITEIEIANNCGEEMQLESYTFKLEHKSNMVTLTDEDGDSFSAPLFGKQFIGAFALDESGPGNTPGTLVISPLSIVIDNSCNALSGIANWRWEDDATGKLSCSGTTSFTGSRTPADGCGDFSDQSVDINPPPVPTGFLIETDQVTTSSIVLYWDGPDVNDANDADTAGYKIYRLDGYLDTVGADQAYGDSGGVFVRYEDANLTAGQEYCYAITAFDMAGNESGITDTQCATALDNVVDTVPPSAPANLQAVAMAANRIDLSWESSTDNVVVSHYNIYRHDRPSPIAVLLSTKTTHSDIDGLLVATNYCYTVTAVDSAGNESVDSNQACVSTQDVVPAAPDGVGVSVTGNASSGYAVVFNWNDNSSNETGFEIGVCTGAMPLSQCVTSIDVTTQIVPANSTTYQYDIGSVTKVSAYTYFVRACNVAGCSNPVGNTVTVP